MATDAHTTTPGVQWKRLFAFFAIAMVLTHTGMAIYLVLGGSRDTPGASAFGAIFMRACPGIVALAFARFVAKIPLRHGLEIFFRPNRWFAAAWLVPVCWVLLTLGLTLLLPGMRYAPDLAGLREQFPGMSAADLAQARARVASVPLPTLATFVLIALTVGPTMSAVAAFGEEIAWRGWVLREVGSLGFWRAALIGGALQAIWHLPFVFEGFFFPGAPLVGCALVTVEIMLMSIVTAYIRVRAKSVIPAAIFHGVGGASGFIAALAAGGHPLEVGLNGVMSSIALVPFVVAVAIHHRFYGEDHGIARTSKSPTSIARTPAR